MYRSKKHRLGVAAVGLSAVLTLAACSAGQRRYSCTAEATEEVVVEESATEDTTQEEAEAAEETCVLPPGDIKVVSISWQFQPLLQGFLQKRAPTWLSRRSTPVAFWVTE